jgi:hypothetical protein
MLFLSLSLPFSLSLSLSLSLPLFEGGTEDSSFLLGDLATWNSNFFQNSRIGSQKFKLSLMAFSFGYQSEEQRYDSQISRAQMGHASLIS